MMGMGMGMGMPMMGQGMGLPNMPQNDPKQVLKGEKKKLEGVRPQFHLA